MTRTGFAAEGVVVAVVNVRVELHLHGAREQLVRHDGALQRIAQDARRDGR